jgi:hypothetical protein
LFFNAICACDASASACLLGSADHSLTHRLPEQQGDEISRWEEPWRLVAMCGIAGEIRFDQHSPDLGIVDQINHRMAHRGPDGSGVFATANRAFAHRRLKIMDLSEAAAQMVDPALGLGIVFNGAIYNHPELRASSKASAIASIRTATPRCC